MSTTYADIADLLTHPNIPATGSDTFLQACLDAAAALIDSHCNTRFVALGVAATELYSGRCTRQFRLRHRPVLTISSISVDGAAIDSSLYALSQDGGGGWIETVDLSGDGYNPRLWRGDSSEPYVWPQGTNNISVTYTYGYTTVPDAVSKACAMLAKQIYDTEIRNGVTAESYGPVSKSYSAETGFQISTVVAALLASYVQYEVGT